MFKSWMFYCLEEQAPYEINLETLVQRAKTGDARAFEQIVVQLRNGIEVHLRKMFHIDHDVLYQESLIILYEVIKKYDSSICDTFNNYYFHILNLRLKDFYRNNKNDRSEAILSINHEYEEGISIANMIIDNHPTPEVTSEYNALIEGLTPAALSLSHAEYRVLRGLMKGMKLEEIALQENTDKKLVYNASERLKKKVIRYLERMS